MMAVFHARLTVSVGQGPSVLSLLPGALISIRRHGGVIEQPLEVRHFLPLRPVKTTLSFSTGSRGS